MDAESLVTKEYHQERIMLKKSFAFEFFPISRFRVEIPVLF